MGARRPTLKDVATASGVSPTTVSFVLNSTPGQTIPESTRDRVRAAADALGYLPHAVAKTLREGRSRIVLVELGDLPSSSVLAGFLRGMRAELAEHGLALTVHAGDVEDTSAGDVRQALAPWAVLDLGGLYRDGRGLGDGGWVDGLASHTMTQLAHLADRGHVETAFALPAARRDQEIAKLRAGYARQAARSLGIKPPRLLLVDGEPARAQEALGDLLRDHPRITAVAAYDDDTALRVLAAASDLGLRVPSELAVIGFDDGPYGELWRPALTTVHIEAETFGRRAARVLLGIDPGEWEASPSTVIARSTT